VPYTLDTNEHALCVAAGLQHRGSLFSSYLKDAFDGAFSEEGQRATQRCSLIVCTAGDWPPGRFRALQRFWITSRPMTGSGAHAVSTKWPVLGRTSSCLRLSVKEATMAPSGTKPRNLFRRHRRHPPQTQLLDRPRGVYRRPMPVIPQGRDARQSSPATAVLDWSRLWVAVATVTGFLPKTFSQYIMKCSPVAVADKPETVRVPGRGWF